MIKSSSLIFEDVSHEKQSNAWKYFHLNRAEFLAKCQIPGCAKLFGTKNGTSPLLIHLRRTHDIDLRTNLRKSSMIASEVPSINDPLNQF